MAKCLECKRNWSKFGAPLTCRLQLPVISKRRISKDVTGYSRPASKRSSSSLLGSVRSCGTDGCRLIGFTAQLRHPPGRSISDLHSIAEGSFDVPVTMDGNTSSIENDQMELALEITLARLKLATKLHVSMASSGRDATEIMDKSTSLSRSLQSKLHNGSLHLSTSLPLLRISKEDRRLHFFHAKGDSTDDCNGIDAGKGYNVRIEIGAPPFDKSLPFVQNPREEHDVVVVLEPHLGRLSHYLQNWIDDFEGTSVSTSEGCANFTKGPQIIALPFAVTEGEIENAHLAHRASGPELTCKSEDCSTTWGVPSVSLQWLMASLLPTLVLNITAVSLVLRRSGTVGTPWSVLANGLTQSDRSQLSELRVEWSPADELSCTDAAQLIFDEGFARRGPMICETDKLAELSFQRMVRFQSVIGEYGKMLAPSLDVLQDNLILAPSIPVLIQQRFTTSVVSLLAAYSSVEAEKDTMIESYSVQLPDFYEVWITACSQRAVGQVSEHHYLERPLNARAFMLSLEPRISSWLNLMARAKGTLPPGWAHMRHLALPASVFPPIGNESLVIDSSLTFAIEVLLGGRDVALLVLRDIVFNTSPWMEAGVHARRFHRVRLESKGGDSESVASSCVEAKRKATLLGYGIVRGECSQTVAAQMDVSELLFERLG